METHLRGQQDVSAITDVPIIDAFATSAVTVEGAEVFQAMFEIDARALTSSLPPALHPSLPAHAAVLVARLPGMPCGDLVIGQLRIACRAAISPRGYVLHTFVDGSGDARELTSRWGFAASPGLVEMSPSYHRIRTRVVVEGRTVLSARMVGLQPIPPSALRYHHALNLADTPLGRRLVQAEISFDMATAQRGVLDEIQLDGEAWGDREVVPTHPISATYATGTVSFLPVRYVCDPDELASTGSRDVSVAESEVTS